MAQEEVEETDNQPKKVKLRRKKQSFGFKVRGQVAEGGPRWLIDGREYRNLQTVSDVVPDSVAEEHGIAVGDKILSINGVEVEGAEHETIKDLISGSGDEVELLLISPKELKMLDVPSAVLIHRSDGSTLSLDRASLLQHPTIDEALEDRESNEKVSVQINKVLPKDANPTITEEQELDIESDDTNGDEDHPAISDNVSNIDNEEGQHLKEETEETIEDNNDGVQGKENQQEEEDEVKDEQDVTEGTVEEPVNEEGNGEEQLEDRSSTDLDVSNTVEESNTEKEEGSESKLSVKSTEESSECSCGVIKRKKSPRTRSKEEREIERLKNEMKTMMASVRRLKLSPFSPDIYNNLSPYFSINIKADDSQRDHSSRYGQRATALRVLHPAEAFRLENSDFERQIGTWSANLLKRSKRVDHETTEEATRLREDVKNMYKSIMEKRGRNKNIRSPLLTEKKLTSLSEQFAKTNAQKTLATYLGLGKVS